MLSYVAGTNPLPSDARIRGNKTKKCIQVTIHSFVSSRLCGKNSSSSLFLYPIHATSGTVHGEYDEEDKVKFKLLLTNKKLKLIAFILISLVVVSCNPTKRTQELPRIHAESNSNIHTQLILEHLVRPGKTSPTRPMVTAVKKHFDKFRGHPAVTCSDSLLSNKIFYSDELMEILLYSEPLPGTKYKYPIENTPYSNRADLLNKWKQKVADFYVVADVKGFLDSNKSFYDGAIKEVTNNLPPPDFIGQMEDFYREKKIRYTIIPAPEMKTGDQRGIGPYVRTKEGMLVYQIISAAVPVEPLADLSKYTSFGFNNKDFILLNARHEFGHAFVNPLLETPEITALLDNYKNLFTPSLQKVMEDQNYGTWWDCVAEHFVRLGEIRITERSGDSLVAAKLRSEYIENKKFIFLPELERKIKEYESDKKYKSFASYVPTLIKVFEQFTVQDVNARLSGK